MARALYLRWVNAFYQLIEFQALQAVAHLRRDSRRYDAPGDLLQIDWETLISQSGLSEMLERVARSIQDQNQSYFSKILKTNPPAVGSRAQSISQFRKRNVDLIKNLGADTISDISDTLNDANAKGLRHEETADLIQQRVSVSKSRAKLIARDQTLKYNASVQQTQAQAAGIDQYTWSTSHDSAVRPMHKRLDGKRFSYDDPPVTNEDGDRNNPGEDYQCRCVAIPYISLLADLDDDAPAVGSLRALGGI